VHAADASSGYEPLAYLAVVMEGALRCRTLAPPFSSYLERCLASLGRVVPKSWLHHPELEPAESGGGTVLQQARDGGTMDQRGQAGREDDAAELPSLPLERGATVAECDRLQVVV
jgi:hypothetical protein